jgi:hypothetical protein
MVLPATNTSTREAPSSFNHSAHFEQVEPVVITSSTNKKLLRWLKSQESGATTQAILTYTKWEITEGGATDNAIRKYIEDLKKALFIEYKHPFWKITQAGKKWLELHSI